MDYWEEFSQGNCCSILLYCQGNYLDLIGYIVTNFFSYHQKYFTTSFFDNFLLKIITGTLATHLKDFVKRQPMQYGQKSICVLMF